MNTPNYEEISQRARQLWQQYGSPSGRDEEIWLEAEKQLKAGPPASAADKAAPATKESKGAFTDRVKGEMASESAAEFHISPPGSDEASIKAALQKKEARAPKTPTKSAPKTQPAPSGKPLWDKPHSS